MSLSESAAAEVRAEMARQRRSGKQLATQLGWSQMYLSRRLSGRAPFNLDDLAAIAAALGVPVSSFFPGPGVRTPGSQTLELAA
jgi:transcriptional regulator with XRE-family HTH domain